MLATLAVFKKSKNVVESMASLLKKISVISLITILKMLLGSSVFAEELKKKKSAFNSVAENSQSCPGKNFFSAACRRFNRIAKAGQWNLYLTGYTWHDPRTYSAEKTKSFNEWGLGGGFGKSYTDENGHQDLLYAFVFLESHYKWQPIVGYARQWYKTIAGPVAIGGGYTIGLTMRPDIFKGIPFPVPLPIASIKIGSASIMGVFIPRLNGKANNGNVAFLWTRFEF